MITKEKIEEIKNKINSTTQGEWKLNSIQVKNKYFTVDGDWPEKDDFANMEFISSCRNDMHLLLSEIENYMMVCAELQNKINILEITIEKQAKILSRLEKN